jgi:hypothetical protein
VHYFYGLLARITNNEPEMWKNLKLRNRMEFCPLAHFNLSNCKSENREKFYFPFGYIG